MRHLQTLEPLPKRDIRCLGLKARAYLLHLESHSSSGVGVSSNLTAALVLVVLLSPFRFFGEQTKEVIMNKKHKESKSSACGVKRMRAKLASIVAHFFETVWATGASVAGAMVISTPTH
jgi:hypothetical protein